MFRRGAFCITLLLLLVSSAGAFLVESAEGVPEGYPVYGEELELEIFITFPGLDPRSFPSEDTLELRTGLTNPRWTVDMHRSGGVSTLKQSSKSREMIPGWELSYPSGEDIALTIRVSGTVPQLAEPGKITILSVRQLDGSYALRGENEYLIAQTAYPAGSVPSGTPPDPVVAAPSPPDLSAFTVSERSTTPTRLLQPGETTTLRTYLYFDRIPHITFPTSDTLRLQTRLINATWAVSIHKGGAEIPRNPRSGYFYTIPGFELSYPARENLGLSVAVTGVVPAGVTAPLLEITQCGPDGYVREGAIFAHPAGVVTIIPTETPAPTDLPTPVPTVTPATTPPGTESPTPLPTPEMTPLPPPPKGEIFPDGITIDGILNLIRELIDHGTLFVNRLMPLIERIAGIGS
ncbi:hypothetical protein [Methanocalculus sp.]|uniref:hypothetical protein n=1 Tax=Methanocalculus sp. TaxID=2004547 RepID=UPI002603A0C4|nr:hypothetical protein [Methanocalculus sp.]MDG6250828.1 hypothetical protein [Methanocalculus sp.]